MQLEKLSGTEDPGKISCLNFPAWIRLPVLHILSIMWWVPSTMESNWKTSKGRVVLLKPMVFVSTLSSGSSSKVSWALVTVTWKVKGDCHLKNVDVPFGVPWAFLLSLNPCSFDRMEPRVQSEVKNCLHFKMSVCLNMSYWTGGLVCYPARRILKMMVSRPKMMIAIHGQ